MQLRLTCIVLYATLLTDAAPSATAGKDPSAGAIAGGKGASVVTANNSGTPYVVAVAADAAGTMGAVVATEFTPSDLPRVRRRALRPTALNWALGHATCEDAGMTTVSSEAECKSIAAFMGWRWDGAVDAGGSWSRPTACNYLVNSVTWYTNGGGDCGHTSSTGCVCTTCDTSCGTCSSGNCDSCTNGNWYQSADKQSCVMSCPDGTWQTDAGYGKRTCTACDITDCNICGGAASCTQCKNSKYYTGGGDTSRPWKDATCTTSCAAGTFPAGTGVTGRTCTCDVTSCGTCSEVGKCDSCTDGKYLVVDKTSCLAACPVGTYSDDNGGSATGRKCMPCGAIADCGKCSVAGLCDECANSKFLDVPTKTCPTVCPDGSYGDDKGGAAVGRTCKACDVAHCGKCSKSGECDECKNLKFLAVDKTACLDPCPGGSYGAGTGETGRTCVACDVTDCGQCSEAGKCDECQSSKFLAVDTTTCPTACPVGTYSDDNGGSATGRKCMPCSAITDCGKCSIAGLCDECANGKFLDVPTKTCPAVCLDGSFGDDNGGAATGRTCTACDVAHCGKCSKSGECDECKNSKFLAVDKTACLDPCPGGSYGAGTGETGRTCVACDVTDCGQCSEAGKCDECQNSKYLVVGKTACPATCPVQFYGVGSGEIGRECKAQATCGNANTESAAASPVSDADCGVGFIADADAASATSLCAGGACDPTNVAADRAACCVALATCGDKNGAAAGTDAVSDSDCGDGAVYKIESASTTCRTFMCDVSSTVDFEGDKASCCMKVGTCSSVTDSMCGNGFIYNIANPKVNCAGATCDPINVPADRTACCVPQATCGAKPVTSDDCGANFVFKDTSGGSLCVGVACSPSTVTADRDACCVVENCVVGSTWSAAGTAPCALCKKAADCVHGAASACDATTNLVCKLSPPTPCVAGSTWSATGAAPCGPCKKASGCVHGMSSSCDPGNDLVCNDAPPPCVAGSTYSVSGKAPCALCRKAADCVHGTRAACDAYSNLICKVPPPTVACVAGSTWSSTSNAPCAICKQASECAHGIMYRCDPANDLECNDAPLPCVAGSTYSVSGAAPCGDCKQASDCIHGSVSNCTATKNRVCADSKNSIIDGGGGGGGATNDTTSAVVPPPLNRKPTVQVRKNVGKRRDKTRTIVACAMCTV